MTQFHAPEWTEYYASKANDDKRIVFRCTVCGKQAMGSRADYRSGKWRPPMKTHN
jgi:hypothetical protein